MKSRLLLCASLAAATAAIAVPATHALWPSQTDSRGKIAAATLASPLATVDLVNTTLRPVSLPPLILEQAGAALRVDHLRCEYKEDPLGIDALHPRLSWQLLSTTRGQKQTAYEILVARSKETLAADKGDLWDSGKVVSDNSVALEYHGLPLQSGQQCFWKVRAWDKDGQPTPGSAVGIWQMGLLKPSDWKAEWIAAQTPRDTQIDGDNLPPSPYVRKSFIVGKPVKQATIFATARGVYELHLNGAKLGDAVLAPGWTDYNKRIEYQAYDVTAALHPGANMIGAIVGDGWYSGYVGFSRQRNLYGSRPALRLQMDITYTDGTHQVVMTDGTWRGRTGPITYSDMLQGESYDARAELTGWDRAGSAASGWQPVSTASAIIPSTQVSVTATLASMVKNNTLSVTAGNELAGDPAYNTVKKLRVNYTLGGVPHTQIVNEKEMVEIPGPGEKPGKLVIRSAVYGALDDMSGPVAMVATVGPPVRVTQYMPTRKITQPTPGTYLIDIGQNMVGWVRLKVQGAAGTRVRMRFAEVLNPDGNIYTANLRSAHATDTYVCRGGGKVETFEPHFTFHGFRYVEVTGYPGTPGMDAITGCVIGSDTPVSGIFTCSQPMVNQLVSNINWGQRGNFISVPTDCPQRDERLGWMGDAQIFVRTATYNRDVAAFYENWMYSVSDGQSAAGGFSDVSPRIVDTSDGAPAWGDAGVIVPWTVYEAYGDTGILKQNWGAMNRWIDYITSMNPNGLWLERRNSDFGDWLSINDDTPKEVLATAYYAYDASLMAQMARALGHTEEASKYDALFTHIREAYDTAYVSADGHIKGNTQTDYVLALRFNLLPDALRPPAAQFLVDNIASKGNHLSTGFVGVGYLCPVLTKFGHNDTAYKLLLNDTFPSWGYSIKQGATTVWERWDGYTKEKGFQDPGMNSFNHYSLGSVGQWLYQDVAGIDTDPKTPGYGHILLHPHPGSGLTHADATYASIRGPITSNWKVENGQFAWDVSVPANTTATAWVPTDSAESVMEGGRKINADSGIVPARSEDGSAVYELPSGKYHFTSRLGDKVAKR
ncbi:MAG: family 78 glycoside hydrolase catalytic domain [Janthinobacterium lividum]